MRLRWSYQKKYSQMSDGLDGWHERRVWSLHRFAASAPHYLPSGMQVSRCCVSPLPSLVFYASQSSVTFVGSSSLRMEISGMEASLPCLLREILVAADFAKIVVQLIS